MSMVNALMWSRAGEFHAEEEKSQIWSSFPHWVEHVTVQALFGDNWQPRVDCLEEVVDGGLNCLHITEQLKDILKAD